MWGNGVKPKPSNNANCCGRSIASRCEVVDVSMGTHVVRRRHSSLQIADASHACARVAGSQRRLAAAMTASRSSRCTPITNPCGPRMERQRIPETNCACGPRPQSILGITTPFCASAAGERHRLFCHRHRLIRPCSLIQQACGSARRDRAGPEDKFAAYHSLQKILRGLTIRILLHGHDGDWLLELHELAFKLHLPHHKLGWAALRMRRKTVDGHALGRQRREQDHASRRRVHEGHAHPQGERAGRGGFRRGSRCHCAARSFPAALSMSSPSRRLAREG